MKDAEFLTCAAIGFIIVVCFVLAFVRGGPKRFLVGLTLFVGVLAYLSYCSHRMFREAREADARSSERSEVGEPSPLASVRTDPPGPRLRYIGKVWGHLPGGALIMHCGTQMQPDSGPAGDYILEGHPDAPTTPDGADFFKFYAHTAGLRQLSNGQAMVRLVNQPVERDVFGALRNTHPKQEDTEPVPNTYMLPPSVATPVRRSPQQANNEILRKYGGAR